MNHIIKKLAKSVIFINTLALMNVTANAQVSLLQKTIDKLENYKNFSYQYVYKQKDEYSDTLIDNRRYVLSKTPEDKTIGYFIREEGKDANMKILNISLYNGKNLLQLNPADSSFDTRDSPGIVWQGSIISELNLIENFVKKKPTSITQSSDTTYNLISSYHLILTTKDTIVNKEHLYTHIHLFIDKATGLPVGKFTKARTDSFGKEVKNYYVEEIYSDYQINDGNISTALFNLPGGYHPAKEEPEEQVALLPTGMPAPGWTLYDTDGKATSLAQLKGKVVMMDFFYVGCGPCLQSLATLDRLYEKYKDKNFVMLSISDRDSKKLVTALKKTERIKNQMYPAAADVAKAYHITAAPTFYIIDKDGEIASASIGYDDNSDFETRTSSLIDGLLKK